MQEGEPDDNVDVSLRDDKDEDAEQAPADGEVDY